MESSEEKVVLLDRDGVIIEHIPNGYALTSADIKILPGAAQAILKFNSRGFKVCVISNQQCVGKGLLTLEELDALSEDIRQQLRDEAGAEITEFFYCPHLASEDCECRKPKAGLILEAQKAYSFDPHHTYLVGDSYSDLAAGHAAGCLTILVLSGADGDRYRAGDLPPIGAEVAVADLAAAARHIVDFSTP